MNEIQVLIKNMIHSYDKKYLVKKNSFIIQLIGLKFIISIYFLISYVIQKFLGKKKYDNVFFIIHILSNKIPFFYTYLIISFIYIFFPIILGIYFMNKYEFIFSLSEISSSMIGTPISLTMCNLIGGILSSRISILINFAVILIQTILLCECMNNNLQNVQKSKVKKICFFGYLGYFLILRSFNYNIMYHICFN
ncbi:hypothetical protein DMUE_4472 [Dictyocoela muelleri]|nr:hypothetical protein DMUE_4472 [Dictyocoela muelleri]